MANETGSSSYVGEQLTKFLDGLEKAGDPNRAQYIRGQLTARTDPGKQPQINVPAWNDVIRTGPRPIVTPEDRATQRAFQRAGLPSPLSPSIQAELARRDRFAQSIPNSATPHYMDGLSQALNAVDNVQDAALTAAVGARVGLGLAEAGFALGAARLAGGAAGASGALAALVPRLFPVIALALRGAALLNWLSLALLLIGPLYALACGGTKDALRAAGIPFLNQLLFKGIRALAPRSLGMPGLRPGKGNKPRVGRAASRHPGGRRGTAPNRGRYGALGVTFAEAVQAAQAAEAWTGYGIALGGVVGAVSDTAFSQARGTRGLPGGARSPAVNHEYAALIAPRLAGLSDGALWLRQTSARQLATAPFILANPELYGDDTYALTWLMCYVSQEVLSWDQGGLPWRDIIAHADTASWRGYIPTDGITRAQLLEAGRDPDDPGPWPLPSLPRELTAAHYMDELAPAIGAALVRWCQADPLDPLRAFVAELSGATTERFWTWLEDSPDFPRWELTEDVGVVESMILSNRWPIISDPIELLDAAWNDSRQLLADQGRKWLTAAELDRIWTAHGTPLLRILPADAPIPPEWFIPYDETTGAPGELVAGATLPEARAMWYEYQKLNRPKAPPTPKTPA